ncbi:MAG: hypothetical protein GWN55_16330 [Phycisphaerae bacterium]|nr:DUF1801 domain-containing protein [Phycisphaerae bacterium]NIS16957.1 DUF1801 domain-containing protein [candidate division Zixibacteria bacterium]NIS27996.1 DUF1801 domain-containing protein [candidate division KSB1 bacterium]NIU28649.1 DUF1801 domain-containing protein [candidate division KSB1 bacterium]NIV02861.1 hypothetical protein [Phycisphaerae bacterium]
MDPAVKKYIDKQKSPQKKIIRKLRRIVLKAYPKIKEEMYVGVPWYGGMFYLVALKDHVNMGFAIKGMKNKEMDLFEGRGKMMRHLKFFTLKDIDEKTIVRLMRIVKRYYKGSCHASH